MSGVSSVPAKANLMGKKAKETKMEPNITDIASQTLSMARSHGAASAGIAYSVGTSTFGNILVARDALGVCAMRSPQQSALRQSVFSLPSFGRGAF
jgi:hypothetical protein